MGSALTNWAGNHTFAAARVVRAGTVQEVQSLVSRAEKVKVIGTRHSFNDIADTVGTLLSLEQLDRVVKLEPRRDRPAVTVEAGVTCAQLCRYLHAHGYALHNLASLPHISVAGACATATHGSGDGNSNLAAAVSAMEVVTADGEIKVFTREEESHPLAGAVVSLGGLGVVLKLTLDVVPAYEMTQTVYEGLPLEQLAAHFDEIVSAAYSVSLFTDWRSDRVNQVWLKRRVSERAAGAPDLSDFGATPALERLHPIRGISPVHCTEQLGIPGPWHERLPHFRIEFMPSSGEELQSEYLVPRHHAVAAIEAIHGLRHWISPLLQISEIRTIAADDLWMSPCYRQACVGIHFTWTKNWPAVRDLLPEIERRLAPFDARPHWGKLFTMQPAQLQPLYPKLPHFRQLLQAHDPRGKFRNAFLDRHIFSTP